MPGIKIRATPVEIRNSHSGELESVEPVAPYNSIPEFPFYFAPILVTLGEYHWYVADIRLSPFMSDSAGLILEQLEDDDIPDFYPKGSFFPLFAPYIMDNWATLYGFSTLDPMHEHDEGYVMETAIFFHNCDGLWWEMYCVEEKLLSMVKNYLSYFPTIEVDEQLLHAPERLYPTLSKDKSSG